MSLALLLDYALVFTCNVRKTTAVDVISKLLGKCERTIRAWKSVFISNVGEFPDSEQGRY